MALVKCTDGTTEKVLMKDLIGRQAQTTVVMRNQVMEIPAGTKCEITGHWRSGVSITAEACSSCGVKVRLFQVPRTAIVLVK